MQSGASVVDRLMLYKDIYETNRNKALKKLPVYSYFPKINSYSKTGSSPDLYSPRARIQTEPLHSFKPSLDSNSLKIAERLGPFGSRTVHSKSISHENYSFRPEINKTASVSSRKSSSSRWNHLYSLNLERRERLELLRRKFAENDIDFECTFHPKTCKPVQSLSLSNTVQRLHDWNRKKQAKLEAAKNSNNDKDYEECTFKPSLYSSNIINSTIDFYPDQAPKKKSYTEIHKQKYTPDKIEWNSEKVAPLFISDINSNEYDEAIKELHDLLHISLK
jgi:HEPN domain-containing protein